MSLSADAQDALWGSGKTYRFNAAHRDIKNGAQRDGLHGRWVALRRFPGLGGLGALGFITPVVSYGPRGILAVSRWSAMIQLLCRRCGHVLREANVW